MISANKGNVSTISSKIDQYHIEKTRLGFLASKVWNQINISNNHLICFSFRRRGGYDSVVNENMHVFP